MARKVMLRAPDVNNDVDGATDHVAAQGAAAPALRAKPETNAVAENN
jgi:hypothetical protein